LKVTILGSGTSQGVPVIACKCHVCNSLDFRDKRLRASINVEVDGVSFVIDSGPDFRQQMLRENIQKMDALLFTHEHKDHTAGMDDIRSFNYKDQRPMPVFGRTSVLNQIKQEFSYIFQNAHYPGVPQVELHEINNSPFKIQDVEVIPIEVMHYKLPVFGFRVKDFTYITDANYIAPKELEKVKGTRVLVINALQREPHISHFTIEEALKIVEQVQPEKAYFTHISHKLGLHAQVQKELPNHVFLAYDGLVLNL
jgi:phosphoribosyl 1,2-cyclic phosphate phosphodiesterase